MCVRGHVNTLQVNLSLHEIKSKVTNCVTGHDAAEAGAAGNSPRQGGAGGGAEEAGAGADGSERSLEGGGGRSRSGGGQDEGAVREGNKAAADVPGGGQAGSELILLPPLSPILLAHALPQSRNAPCCRGVWRRTPYRGGARGGGLCNCFASGAVCYPSDWLLLPGDFV